MSTSNMNATDGSKAPVPRSQSASCSAPETLHHTNNSTPVTLTLTNATASEFGATSATIPSTSSRPENSPYPKPFLPEQQSSKIQNDQSSSQTYGLRGASSQRSAVGGGMKMTQPHNVRGVLMKHHTTIAPRLGFQSRAQHAQSFNALLVQHSHMVSDRSKTMYHHAPPKMHHTTAIPHNGQPLPSHGTTMKSIGHTGYSRGNPYPDTFIGTEESYDAIDYLSQSMEEEKIQQLRNASNVKIIGE